MELKYGELFQSAWDSLKHDLALVAGLTAVFGIGTFVLSVVPVIGHILAISLLPGYMRCLLKIRAKETISFEDFFWTLRDFNRFLHFVILQIIITVVGAVAILCLIIPGIWWFVSVSLSLPLFLTGRNDAVEAVKSSMALVKGRWWEIAGILLANWLLCVAGMLCLGVGILVAFPISIMVMLLATEKLSSAPVQPQSPPSPMGSSDQPIESQIVPQ